MKERLVGAAVLIALGVWLIPWILDGRDPPAPVPEYTADAVELPAADEPVRTQTRTIALNEPARPGVATGDAAREAASGAPVAEPRTEGSAASVQAPASERKPAAAIAEPARESAPEAAAKPVEAGGWFVQLGSFSDADNARRLAARVGTFGYDADVSTYRSGGRTLNRVRVGPSATREAAEAVASSLSAHGFVAQVVSAD